jgi:hypothetical protein
MDAANPIVTQGRPASRQVTNRRAASRRVINRQVVSSKPRATCGKLPTPKLLSSKPTVFEGGVALGEAPGFETAGPGFSPDM